MLPPLPFFRAPFFSCRGTSGSSAFSRSKRKQLKNRKDTTARGVLKLSWVHVRGFAPQHSHGIFSLRIHEKVMLVSAIVEGVVETQNWKIQEHTRPKSVSKARSSWFLIPLFFSCGQLIDNIQLTLHEYPMYGQVSNETIPMGWDMMKESLIIFSFSVIGFSNIFREEESFGPGS